ncbi:MAG: Rrf2 family transcriptional regulator [Marinilabiliales bacterium]|nr:Rrf2 family transcriptional regulator [Marinilabiliales bacterium]
MNFSKTTDYAFRIMRLMSQDELKLFTVEEIYQQIRIPYRYLRKLMTHLTRSDFMESVQGKKGGFRLSRPSSQITLLDILKVVDPEYLTGRCFFGFENCALDTVCIMHDQWTGVRANVHAILANTSLADLHVSGDLNEHFKQPK